MAVSESELEGRTSWASAEDVRACIHVHVRRVQNRVSITFNRSGEFSSDECEESRGKLKTTADVEELRLAAAIRNRPATLGQKRWFRTRCFVPRPRR